MNREEWLNHVMSHIDKVWFTERAGRNLPPDVKVSCGFPSKGGLGKKKRTLGECWHDECSGGHHHEIFINPCLASSVEVVDVLIHEMCHTIAGVPAKHGKLFKKVATSVGLEGKMTSTIMSEELKAWVEEYLLRIEYYPHDTLDSLTTGKKKDGTRMLKLECTTCGYVIRTTKKWIETGIPVCACGTVFATPPDLLGEEGDV